MVAYNLKSIKEDFKSKGIFYTPKDLAMFMKSFLPDEIKEIYDPTCGDGALLEVFNDDVVKYGQDIDKNQLAVAKDRLTNFTGVFGDTLKEPAFKEKQFDYIVANPPFSISWEPNEVNNSFNIAPVLPPKSKADYAFILHILSKLSDKGIAVIMGFPGILYRGNSEGKIRRWLIEQNIIEKIVSIPGDKFVDTKISTCLMVLNKNKQTTDVLFIDDFLKKEKIVSLDEIERNDFNLSVSQFIQEEKKEILHNPKKLQELARNQMKTKLEKDILMDMQICELENWDNDQYLNELISLIKSFKRKRIKEHTAQGMLITA